MIPETIGPYRIIRPLGQGAMGVVYLGYDPAIGREVAIKTLPAVDSLEQGALQQALEREARAAGRLSHPGIVTIYQMGRDGPTLFIAMEYIAGPTLDQWVSAAPPPNISDRLRVLRGVAEALDYAHGQQIVHRDVKPRNILITPNGAPKVADFGLAKLISPDGSLSGHIVGTPRYISPEQIKAERVDGRSDQFSLAIIAYELLSGRKPFDADTSDALLYQILLWEPQPVHLVNPALPAAVSPVLARGLAKKPEARYATCAEFLSAIVAAFDPALRRPLQSTHPRMLRVEWIMGGLLTFGLATGIPVWYAVQHWRPQPPPIDDSTKRLADQREAERKKSEEALRRAADSQREKPDTKKNPSQGDGETTVIKKQPKPDNEETSPNPHPAENHHPDGDPEATVALYAALQQKRPLPVIEELLRRGASVSGDLYHVPLTAAAEHCDAGAVKLLLEKGANPNTGPVSDRFPLTSAAENGCLDAAQVLLDAGAKVNPLAGQWTPLVAAAYGKSVPVVRLLLARGADPNKAAPNGPTPLTAAAAMCATDVIEVLLDKGAAIDQPGFQKKTALFEAASNSCGQAISVLLAKKANANKADEFGATPLYILLQRNTTPDEKTIELARLLLDKGADPNIGSKTSHYGPNPGSTPLMLSIDLWRIGPMFRLILSRGGDPLHVDGQGRTTLMYAVEKRNPEAVALLLSRGVPVNGRDKSGTTAMGQAKEISSDKEILQLLEKAGAVE